MKLQKTTWVLVIITTILGGFTYWYSQQDSLTQEKIVNKKELVFDFTEADIQSIIINKGKQNLVFVRNESIDAPWQMKQPENIVASDAAVSFLVNLLVNGESDRTFTITEEQKKDYGLNNPFATIEIRLKDRQNRKLILGNPSFNNEFIYAQKLSAQPTSDKLQVILVGIDFQYAVERELNEWKQSL